MSKNEYQPLPEEEVARRSREQGGKNFGIIRQEHALLHGERREQVAAFGAVDAAIEEESAARAKREKAEAVAFAKQQHWANLLRKRTLKRGEIEHGEKRHADFEAARAKNQEQLEDFANAELVNARPLLHSYLESALVHERALALLPGWLKRRKSELAALEKEIREFAKENGIEHLCPV